MSSSSPQEIDPIAESAARHMRRALALLTAGQRVFARLYLVLLAHAFTASAARDKDDAERDGRALKRYAANVLAAAGFTQALLDAGFFGTPGGSIDVALEAVRPLPLEEHPFERIGSVVANIWCAVHNPHWDNREVATGGFNIRVEARLKGEAYVDAILSFPDDARSTFKASKLCASISEGKLYAGKIAALFDALITIEQQANALAPPAQDASTTVHAVLTDATQEAILGPVLRRILSVKEV